ncbi:MAG: hypothetical protein WAJ94_03060 [Candidatus Cybelea sp.]
MPSEFRAICETARQQIAVPEIPLMTIRLAAEGPASQRRHGKRIITGVLLGLVILGAAAAAAVWRGTHLSFGPSGALRISTVEAFHLKKTPTTGDLRAIARQAKFAVQFPSGLPSGTTIAEIGYGPSILLVDYNLPGGWRRSNHLLRIALVDRRTLTAANSPRAFVFRIGGLAATGSTHWTIGHEVVIVMHSLATQKELANIKRTMTAAALQR